MNIFKLPQLYGYKHTSLYPFALDDEAAGGDYTDGVQNSKERVDKCDAGERLTVLHKLHLTRQRGRERREFPA